MPTEKLFDIFKSTASNLMENSKSSESDAVIESPNKNDLSPSILQLVIDGYFRKLKITTNVIPKCVNDLCRIYYPKPEYLLILNR